MKSWKTTAAAIVGILLFVGSKYFGLAPESVAGEGEAIGIIIGLCSGFFARDNNKSSEEVGANASS